MSNHIVEPKAELSLLGITGTFTQISPTDAGMGPASDEGAFFLYNGSTPLGGHNGVLSSLIAFTGAAQAVVHTGFPTQNGTLIQLLEHRTTSTRNMDHIMSLAC